MAFSRLNPLTDSQCWHVWPFAYFWVSYIIWFVCIFDNEFCRKIHVDNCILFDLIGMASGVRFSYPESAANGWTGLCATGSMQSPIDLDPDMVATIHSPITYKNYFSGHFNKVCK